MKHILVEEQNEVIKLTFNRPKLHNAFNDEMIGEVTSAMRAADKSDSARFVLLSGEGSSFCAGADLDWMKSMVNYSLEENRQDSLGLFDMFKSIRDCSLPVVAKVHGNAFGGGLGIIAACDIVAAEESTNFCFSEVKLGLVPAVISPFVKDKCPLAKVKEWMLTAKVFQPPEALESGLINFSGTNDQVEQFIGFLGKLLKKAGPEAVKETKKLIHQLDNWSWDERRSGTAEVIAARRVSAEGQKGLSAFFDKKPADWNQNG